VSVTWRGAAIWSLSGKADVAWAKSVAADPSLPLPVKFAVMHNIILMLGWIVSA
jgi:hypothetical protein